VAGSSVEQGRAAYDERRWADCVEALRAADEAGELQDQDVKALAISLYLIGDDAGCEEVMERGHQEALDRGSWRFAAQVAFWHGFTLFGRGEHARAGAWLARTRVLVAEHHLDGVEASLPDVVEARGLLAAGRADEAMALARDAALVGRELRDPNLEVLGRLTVGQVLLQQGRTDEALGCLDEVMLTVSRSALDPPVAGLAYCAVISTCMGLLDLPRAREWTGVLSEWCDSQDGLVPFRGQCLVHRSQLKAMEGDWPAALDEAQRATLRLGDTASGNAWYQLGEVHRLRGAWTEAEDAYRRANALGRQPEPGLALMRLAQGRTDAAVTTFRRLYAEPDRIDRLDVLTGYVEVMLVAGDLDAAQSAADELAASADAGPLVHRARSQEALGAVRLARGDAAQALACLRPAAETWRSLAMPYDVARVRVRIGDACRALGDDASAALEHDAARDTFTRLGAGPDLGRLDGHPAGAAGLTAREVEVLRLVAAGHTNRRIATALVLSEKTVARHLSNIYTKLDLGSRAAATAYAYDHHLV
jgi:DNA-binding CsgD family transcriptional regulator